MKTGDVIQTLAGRIFALIPHRPEIMQIENPWRLLELPGLEIEDLQPTLMQARYALAHARRRYRLDRL